MCHDEYPPTACKRLRRLCPRKTYHPFYVFEFIAVLIWHLFCSISGKESVQVIMFKYSYAILIPFLTPAVLATALNEKERAVPRFVCDAGLVGPSGFIDIPLRPTFPYPEIRDLFNGEIAKTSVSFDAKPIDIAKRMNEKHPGFATMEKSMPLRVDFLRGDGQNSITDLSMEVDITSTGRDARSSPTVGGKITFKHVVYNHIFDVKESPFYLHVSETINMNFILSASSSGIVSYRLSCVLKPND